VQSLYTFSSKCVEIAKFLILNIDMSLSKYKNILGEPGKGIHSYRIANLAIVDILATLAAGFLISKVTSISFVYASLGLFLL